MSAEPVIRVISLGAGVQSSTMAMMASRGELGPMPAAAIFADTGWEPQEVYEWLDWLEQRLAFPVYRVADGNLRHDLINAAVAAAHGERWRGFASAPFFLEGGGMGRRQCTRQYKLAPIRRKLRELAGVPTRGRVKKGVWVEQWIGISADEIQRMKESREAWVVNRFPLIEARISRQDCLEWWGTYGLEENPPRAFPPRSACIGCPYHSNAEWRRMKRDDPAAFEDAVTVDAFIREMPNMEGRQFMHASRKPLSEVDFEADRAQMRFDFLNECEGMCGV